MKLFNRKTKPLVEYIFIDVPRLESYIAQIEGKCGFVPSYNAGLSITGPAAGATLEKVEHKWTNHEMITKLLDHLEKTDQLKRERGLEMHSQVLFCLETCVARKVLFPSNVTADLPGIKELALWISFEPRKSLGKVKESSHISVGPLYLIESYFEDSPKVHTFTAYSAFMYMLDNLIIDNQKLIMPKPPAEKIEDLARRFSLDPFGYLEGLNAHISAPRRIECLYRRRATMIDLDKYLEFKKLVTFGYPIFIADAI